MILTLKKHTLSALLTKALYFAILLVSFSSCKEENTNPYILTPEQIEAQKVIDEETIRKYFRANNVDTTKVVRTNSGLYILTKKQGHGDLIVAGQRADIHYVGKNVNNDVFDSSYWRGDALSVLVGSGQVIKGWDEALQLMRSGEEANIYIPSYLGYGFYGSGSIPPNAVLIFNLEVMQVR